VGVKVLHLFVHGCEGLRSGRARNPDNNELQIRRRPSRNDDTGSSSICRALIELTPPPAPAPPPPRPMRSVGAQIDARIWNRPQLAAPRGRQFDQSTWIKSSSRPRSSRGPSPGTRELRGFTSDPHRRTCWSFCLMSRRNGTAQM